MNIFKALTGIALGILAIIAMTYIPWDALPGQLPPPNGDEEIAHPCEFITGQCCPADPISILGCNDGDICTADYCVLNGNVGQCIHLPVPNPGCDMGGADAGNGPGGDNGADAGGPDGGQDGGPDGGDIGQIGADIGGGSSAFSIGSGGSSAQSVASGGSSDGISSGGSSSAQACTQDADCTPSCNNKCELVDDVGCAMKCTDLKCVNNQCISGHKACPASECPSCDEGFDCRGGTGNQSGTPSCPGLKPTICPDGSQPTWQDPSVSCQTSPSCGGRCGKCPTSSSSSSSSASSQSSTSAECGNGIWEEEGPDGILYTEDDEECDDGPLATDEDYSHCSTTCKVHRCGNRIVDKLPGNPPGAEQCDDGEQCADGTECFCGGLSTRFDKCCTDGSRCQFRSPEERPGDTCNGACQITGSSSKNSGGSSTVSSSGGSSASSQFTTGSSASSSSSSSFSFSVPPPPSSTSSSTESIASGPSSSSAPSSTVSASTQESIASGVSSSIIIAQSSSSAQESLRIVLAQSSVSANGCVSSDDCSIGICKNGDCVPCITDAECVAGSCNNGKCAGPNLVAAAGAFCGNGILDSSEECDDGNRRDDDGCSATCLLEIGICGDGVVQKLLGEQCEQASHDSSLPYGCTRCLFASRTCGDGTVDPGEECDDGARNSTSPNAGCRPDCHAYRCGDGVLDRSEICDDGNRLDGDGCDRYCRSDRTAVAADSTQEKTEIPFGSAAQQYAFPFMPSMQALPMQLPFAQLQPLVVSHAPAGDTGPAAVAVIGAGAAAGWSWMRRRSRK